MTLKRKAVIVKFQIFLNSIESGLSLNTIPLHESWSLVGSLFTFFQIEVWSLVVGFSCGRKSWRKHFWSNYENQQKNLKGKTVTSDSWIEPRPQKSHHCVIHAPYLLSAHHIAYQEELIHKFLPKRDPSLQKKCFLALNVFFFWAATVTLDLKMAPSSCIMWHELCGQTVTILWTV